MGELWAVSCYFNPIRYQTKVRNFSLFRQALRKQRVPLLATELAFSRVKYELGNSDADILVRLSTEDVMWHKEKLYNLALRHLPSSCTAVAFLDADILFEQDDWAERTLGVLNDAPIAQPFSRAVKMNRGDVWLDPALCPVGCSEGQVFHGFAYGTSHHGPKACKYFLKHGYTGYGWAMRRELADKHGWYDAAVLGGGDALLSHAVFGNRKNSVYRELTKAEKAHYDRWATKFYADVKGRISYVDGAVLHLWHGARADRGYKTRSAILREAEFDPVSDLFEGENGLWQWGAQKPELRGRVLAYFESRREDGGESSL